MQWCSACPLQRSVSVKIYIDYLLLWRFQPPLRRWWIMLFSQTFSLLGLSLVFGKWFNVTRSWTQNWSSSIKDKGPDARMLATLRATSSPTTHDLTWLDLTWIHQGRLAVIPPNSYGLTPFSPTRQNSDFRGGKIITGTMRHDPGIVTGHATRAWVLP